MSSLLQFTKKSPRRAQNLSIRSGGSYNSPEKTMDETNPANEESPLLRDWGQSGNSVGSNTSTIKTLTEIPQGVAGDGESIKSSIRSTLSRSTISPPTTSSNLNKGRILLLIVALLYGSLSVSLRMVYARPGPPAASILSATRGWMTVVCLAPIIWVSRHFSTSRDPPAFSGGSFYAFCLELAFFNFGTQGLLNIGLLTTESARSAFFTQLSVVITPILAATIGLCRRKKVVVTPKVWIACFLALFGLYILSSDPTESSSAAASSEATSGDDFSWTTASISMVVKHLLQSLSFGDWCCLGSAFCWSYYIYRLSDWGDRYDEAETMFVKNIFMAILYTIWTVVSYVVTTIFKAAAVSAVTESNATATEAAVDTQEEEGFYLWEGWRDPIALGILFYTALSSGAISDILQQKGQAHVSAAESNVILSLEPVFAALLGLAFLAEIPSTRECMGGFCIVLASVLASA